MSFRASLSQLLAVIGIMSALAGLLVSLSSGPVVWNYKLLPYHTPNTPEQFSDNGRPAPYVVVGGGWSIPAEYEDGNHLFQTEYRFGWEVCRKRFYDTGNFMEWDREIYSLNDLNSMEWTPDHLVAARIAGTAKFQEQIRSLLESNSKSDVRKSIGYPSFYRVAISVAIGAAGIILLVWRKPSRMAG